MNLVGLSGRRGRGPGSWGAASASCFELVLGLGRESRPDSDPSRRRGRPAHPRPASARAHPARHRGPGRRPALCWGPTCASWESQRHPDPYPPDARSAPQPRRWDHLPVSRLRQGSPGQNSASRSTALGYAAPLTSRPLRPAWIPISLSGSGTAAFPAEPLSGAGSLDLEVVGVTRAHKTHICGALVLNPAALF